MLAAALAALATFVGAAAALAADGDLVSSFGSGGVVLTQLASGAEPETYSQAAAVQADGKIVVAGYASDLSTGAGQIFVARYLSNGSLDTSFGSGGKTLFQASSPSATTQYSGANEVVIQPDGRIVVAGLATDATNHQEVAVARLNSNGSLDGSFGTGGLFVHQYDSSGESSADGLALDGSQIVLAGYDRESAGPALALVVRLNANGTPDGSFGSGGVVDTQLSAAGSATQQSDAYGVVVQGDGKLLIAGDAYDSFGHQATMVARLNPNGSRDSTFGAGGVAIGQFGASSNPDSSFASLALAPDGKIVATGDARDASGNFEFLAAQLNQDGSFDKSFGAGGAFVHQYSTGSSVTASYGFSIAAQPNNKLLITGYAYVGTGSNTQILTVRLNPDGGLDQSFGSAGVRLVQQGQSSPSGSYSDGYFILPQPDGTALLVGDASDTTNIHDEQLLIEKLTIDQPPMAAFAAPSVALGQTAAFSSAGSSDADGSIASSHWSFGDGSSASGAAVTHAFAAPGTYHVTLTVTDDYGLSSTAVRSVVVPVPCTASPRSRTVSSAAAAAAAAAGSAHPRDALQLSLRCAEAVHVTVRGSITARGLLTGAHHGKTKPGVRTIRLRPTSIGVGANQTVGVAVKLPSSAIALLRKGFRESARLTVTATAGRGSSTVPLTISDLQAR